MGGGSQTTVQKADPWSKAAPFIEQGLEDANKLYEDGKFGVDPYGGSSVAGLRQGQINAGQQIIDSRVPQVEKLTEAQDLAAGVGQNAGDMQRRFSRVMDNQAKGIGRTAQQVAGEVRGDIRGGPNAQFANAAGNVANGQVSARLAGMGEAQSDMRLDQAANANLGTGNDARFDSAVNQMTGNGYPQQLQDQLRRNVERAVMPGVNQTFARSGMTGSTLHREGLAEGLSAGMAGVESELINRAQDRQFAAGQAAQSAQEGRLARMMNAGQAVDNAASRNFGQNLQAAQTIEGADQGRAGLSLQAGGQLQNAEEMARRDMLASGELSSAADARRSGLQMQAAQALQDQANRGDQTALQAAGMAPGLSKATYDPMNAAFNSASVRQNLDQMKLNDQIAKYYETQSAPVSEVNNYLALTSGLGGQFGTNTGTQRQNVGILGALGLGIQGAGALGALGVLSDVRAKENIVRVGTMGNGLGVYVYNYIGDDVPHMGVMAQEVEQVMPEAVIERSDGLKAVDYGMLANV